MTKKNIKITSIFLVTILSAIINIEIVRAQIDIDFFANNPLDIWRGTSASTTYPSSTGGGGYIMVATSSECNKVGSCGLCDGLIVAKNIIDILFVLSILVSVGFIVYGSIRLMLTAGSESNIKESKGIILDALLGLVIALCSWLIINTLLHFLSVSSGGANLSWLPWNDINCIGD